MYALFLAIYLVLNLPFNIELKQPKVLTTIDNQNLTQILKEGHKEIFNTEPNNNRLSMGWAQIALENGHGQKVYNYNLGNIGSRGTVPYYVLGGHKFLAHQNFLEGSKAYWMTLKKMCPSSLNLFDQGLPQLASKQLAKCGYYRANPKHYERILKSLYYVKRKEITNEKGN